MKLQSIIRPGPEVLAAQHAITGTPAYTELLRCVGRALEIDEAHLALLESLTQDVFSVHRPGDVLPIVN